MELATPPPAARAPVAWYSWWLMPLALGGGTVAATFMSSEHVTAAVAGAAATATGSVCVRLLIRSQKRLRSAEEGFRAAQAEHAQQWQQHVVGLERKFSAERAALDEQLTDHAAAHEDRLGEQSAAFDAQLADQARVYEERLAGQAQSYETQLADQAQSYETQLSDQAQSHKTHLAEQDEDWQERLAHQRAAVGRLGGEQLPDALKRLRAGDAIDDLLPSADQCAKVDAELQAELRKILRTSLIGIEEEFNRSTSAEQAVISLGNRIHVLTSKLRGRLHELQGEHGRLPAVARGLMELDQALGPADSLAASISVLGGADRPGRQWQEPQRLLSVVRGGIGRIKDFHRVEVRHLPELGVDGGLVDHLTLIFSHLLDNAARYSPPTEPVTVSGKQVPNGVGIEIQDSGKGLSEEKKREAAHALAGTQAGPGLGGISEDANIGLRVVGILARRYGIRVTFADSPWLGTSVVVVVPHKYFSPLPVTTPAAARAAAPGAATARPTASAAAPSRGPAVREPVAAEAGESAETTPGGLPRRRSRRRETEEPQRSGRTAPGDTGGVSAIPPDESFAGLAAFATASSDIPDPRTSAPAHRAGSETTAPPATTDGREAIEHRTEESD
ncbi:ATP-binding protein [Streptomyces sp. NPDC046805]|uniref:ATP-binding protein n=1 Tax=Streptomyces sp. NPDC046805 TaxID=3155134 RepID=UPI0033FF0CAB